MATPLINGVEPLANFGRVQHDTHYVTLFCIWTSASGGDVVMMQKRKHYSYSGSCVYA